MFTTFVGQDQATGASMPSDATSSPRPRQKKRSQVARACDWCRVHRVKCDSEHPCSNCQSRGVQCSNSTALKSVTLPSAYREIERLRQKVQELELELESQAQNKDNESNAIQQFHSPGSSTSAERYLATRDRERLPAGGQAKRPCEGIHLRTARSPQKTWYGSASLFFFIGRINAFLTLAFGQDFSVQRLMPSAASTLLDAPTTPSSDDDLQVDRRVEKVVGNESIYAAEYLTATQEEYFLDLFWQTYYAVNPIFYELEFKTHYRSLWLGSAKGRKSSALADIVLALCIQYGVSQLQDGKHGPKASNDATIAGRWHYRRCQTLLSSELESPSLSTLQCHLLSCFYLCNASFMNMADHACSQAVRTAYMLGLHLEPPESMPRQERELRKRLWWAVFVQESKLSMKLGRPFLLYDYSTTCMLPAHDNNNAMLAGPSYAPPGEDVTWLTWNLHNTKLMLAARSAYTVLNHSVPSDASTGTGESSFEQLNDWVSGVPPALQIKRQNNGQSLSTDLSALDIEQFAPMWLQRQRLLLELFYHHLCTNLHRPSISFPSVPAPTTLPNGSATECAAHAISSTHITYQVLLSTSILTGWLEAFQWQWNASMSLIGFVLAYPQCTTIPAARNAIDMSITSFEKFADSFVVAGSAADIIRGLSDRLDELSVPQEPNKLPTVHDGFRMSTIGSLPGFNGETTAEIRGVLGESIDLLAAEPFSEFDWPGANASLPDQWPTI